MKFSTTHERRSPRPGAAPGRAPRGTWWRKKRWRAKRASRSRRSGRVRVGRRGRAGALRITGAVLPGRGERASTLDYLVAGLGNPGGQYASTRHNVGFMVADELARRYGAGSDRSSSGRVADVGTTASPRPAEPQTYMNESGRSVAAALRFYKTELDRLLVVHDEVDLDFGACRRGSEAGSPGTTGCARSPTTAGVPTFAAESRGRPAGARRSAARGRLRPVAVRARPGRGRAVTRAADAVESLVGEGLEITMTRYNERDQSRDILSRSRNTRASPDVTLIAGGGMGWPA